MSDKQQLRFFAVRREETRHNELNIKGTRKSYMSYASANIGVC